MLAISADAAEFGERGSGPSGREAGRQCVHEIYPWF